jgi:hypothetical protein
VAVHAHTRVTTALQWEVGVRERVWFRDRMKECLASKAEEEHGQPRETRRVPLDLPHATLLRRHCPACGTSVCGHRGRGLLTSSGSDETDPSASIRIRKYLTAVVRTSVVRTSCAPLATKTGRVHCSDLPPV